MSSNYKPICVDHSPALIATDDFSFNVADDALRAAKRNGHADCALMLGRYSGGLTHVGCPPHERHPHRDEWVDADWLRIAAIATLFCGSPQMKHALDQLPACFGRPRLERLRDLLGIGCDHANSIEVTQPHDQKRQWLCNDCGATWEEDR